MTAGVTVSCVDAAIQTDPVLITALQSSFYNAAPTKASASSQPDTSEPLSQKENQKQEKADKKLKQLIRDTLQKPGRNMSARGGGGGRVVRWCWVNFQCRGVLQFG